MGPQNNSYLHPNGDSYRNEGVGPMGNNSYAPFRGNMKNQSLYGPAKNVSTMDGRST